MNYRHGYHAGNFPDVMKHAVLVMLLERLKQKPQPFSVIDTHAGAGLYDLTADMAQRGGEFRHGIVRVLERSGAPAELAPYLDLVRRRNPDVGARAYPGSPLLIRDSLRDDDRLQALELHPDDAALLRRSLGGDKRVSVHAGDGYLAMKALLPPTPRRGLVFVDPPFEVTDEFERIARAAAQGVKRWPTGQFAFWYPLKEPGTASGLLAELHMLGVEMLAVELWVQALETPGGLNGSGLALLNPPWQFDQLLERTMPWLSDALARGRGAGWRLVR